MLRRACRGFTLLELMVAMVLIGLLFSMVGLVNGHHPTRLARQEAGTLIQLLQTLREQAVLEGREYGLQLESEGYQVLRLEGQDWHPVGNSHRLAKGLQIRLASATQAPTLSPHTNQPHVLALSSDEYTAFTLHLLSDQQPLISLSSDGLNEVAVDD